MTAVKIQRETEMKKKKKYIYSLGLLFTVRSAIILLAAYLANEDFVLCNRQNMGNRHCDIPYMAYKVTCITKLFKLLVGAWL